MSNVEHSRYWHDRPPKRADLYYKRRLGSSIAAPVASERVHGLAVFSD
jgi:hypothetical protein